MSKLPTCEELVKDCQPPSEGTAYTDKEVDEVCERMLGFVSAHLKVAIRGGKKGKVSFTEQLGFYRIGNKDPAHPKTIEAVLARLTELGYFVTYLHECIEFTFDLK